MGPNKRKRILAGSLALLMMVSTGGCTTLSEHKSTAECIQSGKVTASGYDTAEVYEGSFDVAYEADALVTYTKSQYLYWESSQDRYDEILVSAGDMVKKGDVLATFEVSSISESDILERTLAVQQLQSSLNKTIRSYEESIARKQKNMEGLEGADYQIAQLELKKMKSEYAQRVTESEYQITKQQEALDEMLEEKENKELVAPFDGRVSWIGRDFQKGNKVNAGSPILMIEDLDSQMIAFRNSSYKGTVPYLSKVTLKDRTTEQEYTGTIVSCGNVTGGVNDEVLVKLDTELPEGKENVYFKATGFIMQKEKVTLVDSRAIQTEGTENYVYVLNENNATYKAFVTVGDTSAGVTWIIDGLSPGQAVIVE